MTEHGVVDWTPFPNCAALELSVPQGGERGSDLWLNAYVTFGPEQLSDEAVSFTLSVKEGLLKLDLQDCKAVTGTRYGELHQPQSIALEQAVEEVQQETSHSGRSLAARAKASTSTIVSDAELNASATRGRSQERTVTKKQQSKAEVRKVTARGTHSAPSWQIVEPEGQCLNGTYLGPENLCQLAADKADYSVTARFVCRKRDLALNFDPYPRWNFMPRNREALALALIAKKLGRDDRDGEIELCRSTLASKRTKRAGCDSP